MRDNQNLSSLDVSRETQDKLATFQDLLLKWTKRINLVSRSTQGDIWNRHIIDSAQIYRLGAPNSPIWADLGAGGGLPGLVLAILSESQGDNTQFNLVESDQRKATFLRTAARELELPVQVFADRIEKLAPLQADIVSARALSDLTTLLSYAHRHSRPGTQLLFPKGAKADAEIDEARKRWTFKLTRHPSITNPDATILEIGDLSPCPSLNR